MLDAGVLASARTPLLGRAEEFELGTRFQQARRDLSELVLTSETAANELDNLVSQVQTGERSLASLVDVDAVASDEEAPLGSRERLAAAEERFEKGVRRLLRIHASRKKAAREARPERRRESTLLRIAEQLALRDETLLELARSVKAEHGPDDPRCCAILDAEERARSARDRFVRSNVGLVVAIARRYQGRGLALNDLVQEGVVGLLRAIEKFDPERGYRFSTYGSWWIRQAMSRALSNQARTIRIPVHAVEINRKLARARRAVEQESGVRVTPSELAQRTGIDERQVAAFMDLVKEPLSLDAPVGGESDVTLGEFVADDRANPAQCALSRDLAEQLHTLVQRLPSREQTILRLRFGLDGRGTRTLREIGEAAGVSRERIRQLETEALAKLKRMAPLELPGLEEP